MKKRFLAFALAMVMALIMAACDAVLEEGDLDPFIIGYHRWATGAEA